MAYRRLVSVYCTSPSYNDTLTQHPHPSVPISKLPQLVYETKKDIDSTGLVSTIVGHVGDGNFHALILFKTDEEMAKAKELVHRMVKRAIALDGTCEFCSCFEPPAPGTGKYLYPANCLFFAGTGEHGVGIGKKEYLVEELGEGTVQLMKTIKKTIDPLGIFNPGKVSSEDAPASCAESTALFIHSYTPTTMKPRKLKRRRDRKQSLPQIQCN